MEKLNIGIIKQMLMNKLESTLTNPKPKLINESNDKFRKFVDVIKESPILQLEFKVFTNLESKFIDNDLAASRYIDNNINLFEIYTIEEIEAEHEKLKSFINESIENNERTELYESIYTLIRESVINKTDADVDKVHEAYSLVLNHIKQPKVNFLGNIEDDTINEEVLKIAVEKYNQKYADMNESDKGLLQKLIKFNEAEKNELFESYKSELINLLENTECSDDKETENVNKAITKINEMKYDVSTVDENIINLHEFKSDLL